MISQSFHSTQGKSERSSKREIMVERSGVFLLQPDDVLVSMEPAQFVSEDDFQRLLARFPELLVGDQIDPENPRRWILVKREQSVSTNEHGASQWSVDHLFLDQDGVPTLVEIKRQSDSRIRREVVGQLLDYAANCALSWPIELLQSGFERTCEDVGQSSDAVLAALIGPDQDPAEFWARVKTNLLAGRVRLLFVADLIPVELKRIVEFLNQQMDPAEVLAIELRQFANEGLKTLVPIVYGQTQEAVTKRAGGAPGQRWDEQRLFDKLAATVKPAEFQIARKIFEWMTRNGRSVRYGTGRENGSVYPLLQVDGVRINPVYLSSDGKLWLQFGSLEGKPLFGNLELRRSFMKMFNSIDGVSLTDADLTRYPAIPLAKIAADPNGLTKLISALEWLDAEIANHSDADQ